MNGNTVHPHQQARIDRLLDRQDILDCLVRF
jgi:hypothetical protein